MLWRCILYDGLMIGEDDIRRVRDATDIVELVGERVVLKQRGREFWGCCPFHHEKTASFKVDPGTQFYHCFGCGEGGDVFKFVMKTENVDFPDAVRALAQRKSIDLKEEQGSGLTGGKKARLYAVCQETAAFYHQQLMRVKSSGTDTARSYLSERGFGGELARHWQLGYAPGHGLLVRHLLQKGFSRQELVDANVAVAGGSQAAAPSTNSSARDRFYERVMFPISDLQGRVIAFGGRVIGKGEPKYLNSSDTPLFHKRRNLYAIDKAKASITAKAYAIIVEGYTDAIAMHSAGFSNTVATLGTALTEEHLKLLARFSGRVVLLFDGDEAGQRAADKAAELVGVALSPELGNKVDLSVALLPKAQDPADFCASEGADKMQAVLSTALPLLRFALDRRLAAWDLSQPEQRIRALNDVVRVLVPVRNSLLANDYLNYLWDLFSAYSPMEQKSVIQALNAAKPLVALSRSDLSATSGSGAGAGAGTRQPTLQSAVTVPPDAMAERIAAFERELLYLFIEQPAVRTRLAEAFGRIQWSDRQDEAVANMLLTLYKEDVEGDRETMLSRLAARLPDAASLLSGVRLPEFADIEPQRLAGMLMFNIREYQLEQSIRRESAQLRRLSSSRSAQLDGGDASQAASGGGDAGQATSGSSDTVEQADSLFEHIAQLQKELNDLRRKYQEE